MTRFPVAVAAMALALGLSAEASHAVQFDAPINIASVTCPAGSSGYGNARFIVFPFFTNTVPNWRLTIWCNAGGFGRRVHFEPSGTAVFSPWPNVAGSSGVGWPPTSNYVNQYQLLDIDNSGQLDVFQLRETGPDTWTVFLSRAQ